MVDVSFVLIGGLLLGCLYICLSHGLKKITFNPLLVFTCAFFFVYCLVPYYQYSYKAYRYNEYYTDHDHLIAIIGVCSYLIGVVTGFSPFYREMGVGPRNIKPLSHVEKKLFILIVIVPALLGMGVFLKDFLSYDIAYYLKNRIILRKGSGAIILLNYINYLALAVLVGHFLLIEKKLSTSYRLFTIFFLICYFMVNTMIYTASGNRNSVFIMLMISFFVFLSTRAIKVKNLIKIIMFVAVLATLLSIWGQIRTNLDSTTYQDVLTLNKTDTVVKGFLSAFGNYENIVWLVSHQNWDLAYGRSFLAALTNFVPRYFWPDKPWGGGPDLKNIIYPGSYDFNSENISSLTTGLPTEAYMNFGFIGFLVVGVFHGFTFGYLKKKFVYDGMSVIELVIWSNILFFLGFSFLYMEFLGGFSRLVVTSLPLVLVIICSKLHQIKK